MQKLECAENLKGYIKQKLNGEILARPADAGPGSTRFASQAL